MTQTNFFLQELAAGVMLADGGLGTMLLERGLEPGACPELLNEQQPELLQEIALLYLDAGARMVQTNSFGASPLKLAQYGLDTQAAALCKASARNLKQIVGTRAFIAGSCGPTGRLLEPYGDASEKQIRDAFEVQMTALLEGGVDLFCVETMMDLTEAVLAVKTAKRLSPATPVMATMTFNDGPGGFHTMMGVSVAQAAEGLAAAGADIIGSNCGNGLDQMIRIAQEFKALSSLPLIIQANAGLPENQGGRLVYREGPEHFGARARQLVDAGTAIIGGCCGTTPAHIRALRDALRQAGIGLGCDGRERRK